MHPINNNLDFNNNNLALPEKKESLQHRVEFDLSSLFVKNVTLKIHAEVINPFTDNPVEHLTQANGQGFALLKIKKEQEPVAYQAIELESLPQGKEESKLESKLDPQWIKKVFGFTVDAKDGLTYSGATKNLDDLPAVLSHPIPKKSSTKEEITSAFLIDLSFLYPNSQFYFSFDQNEIDIFSYSKFEELIKEKNKDSHPYLLALIKTTSKDGRHFFSSLRCRSGCKCRCI